MGKLFGEYENGKTKLTSIAYDPDKEYYSFLKIYRDKGYHQIILTSDLILSILSYYFIKRKMHISEIAFFEDDENLNREISALITECNEDRAVYFELQNKLNFLFDNESIEIKRIELTGEYGISDNLRAIFFQANGIVGIDKEIYNEEIYRISEFIEVRINE